MWLMQRYRPRSARRVCVEAFHYGCLLVVVVFVQDTFVSTGFVVSSRLISCVTSISITKAWTPQGCSRQTYCAHKPCHDWLYNRTRFNWLDFVANGSGTHKSTIIDIFLTTKNNNNSSIVFMSSKYAYSGNEKNKNFLSNWTSNIFVFGWSSEANDFFYLGIV